MKNTGVEGKKRKISLVMIFDETTRSLLDILHAL